MNSKRSRQSHILHAPAFFAALTLACPVWAAPDAAAVARCLAAAYPETVAAADAPDAVMVRGRKVAIGKSMAGRYDQRLDEAGLLDQLGQRYPDPKTFAAPGSGEDAGRMRNYAFFDAMYGKTPEEARAQLVRVSWPPSGAKKVQFSRVNGANRALEAVGREIAGIPELRRYVASPTLVFDYGKAYGAPRKSVHSYGIAIDFELPQAVNKYWRRDGCREGGDCAYPVAILEDKGLRRLVEIFERHGFIWGGRWQHYDIEHFEYRPELLINECRP